MSIVTSHRIRLRVTIRAVSGLVIARLEYDITRSISDHSRLGVDWVTTILCQSIR